MATANGKRSGQTPSKAVGMVLVVMGVILFSFGKVSDLSLPCPSLQDTPSMHCRYTYAVELHLTPDRERKRSAVKAWTGKGGKAEEDASQAELSSREGRPDGFMQTDQARYRQLTRPRGHSMPPPMPSQ